MKVNHIDIEEMRRLFCYDEDTGQIIRAADADDCYKNGGKCGTKSRQGYIVLGVKGKLYGAHRVVWAMFYGEQPTGQIDHINGIRSDNRIENLRDVPRHMNQQNQRKASKANKLGLLGVSQSGNGFVAVIHKAGKQKYLGIFPTKDEAHQAYLSAKREIHEGCTI
jgi:hypothetical protein